MRLDWLEDILAVLDTGSFARAAEARNLTQSAFTRRIRTIEDGIGTPLFDRARKPVQLLPNVRAREDEMRRMAADLRTLRDGLRQSGAGRVVSLACQHAITTTISPGWCRFWHATGRCGSARATGTSACPNSSPARWTLP